MKLSIKFVALFLVTCLLTGALSGCKLRNEADDVIPEQTCNVYATFYPIYALAGLITDGVPDLQLNCLTQPMDGYFRSYSLSDWDMSLLMQSADVVLAGGQGLESFETMLYVLGENGPAVVTVLNDAAFTSAKAANAISEDSHWLDANPNTYMRIDGAIAITEQIAAGLSILYPESVERYSENLELAKNRLESLQKDMHDRTGDLRGQRVIVMNEALIYTAQEFELDMEMCYARESGEGIYDRDLEKCIELLNGCEARVILIEKQAPEALRNALETAGFRVAALDVLSTRRMTEGSEGYFEAQRENARALAAAFGREVELVVAE